jgi:hypothetical protein
MPDIQIDNIDVRFVYIYTKFMLKDYIIYARERKRGKRL